MPSGDDESEYRLIVIETTGTVECKDTSNAATLIVLTAPTIASQSANDTTCVNGEASFMASATKGEAGILTYQWQKQLSGGSFVDINNENNNTLSLTNVPNGDDESEYRLIVIETTGMVECKDTSDAATLIVLTAPTIASQPTNDTTCVNGEASFMTNATNGEAGTLTYQWQKQLSGGSFVDINNENNNTLSLTNVPNGDDESEYRLIVIETTGMVECKDTSDAATLIVLTAPTIASQPTNDTTCVNGEASFMTNATNGEAGTLTYQWQKQLSGGSFVDINNENNNTLSLTNVPNGDDESEYRLIVIETIGTVECKDTSDAAILIVLTAPTIASQPTNDTTCVNGEATFMASGTKGEAGTLTYQWQKQLSGGSFADINNENSTTLSLSTTPSTDDESEYRLIVTETTGTIECKDTSDAATLIVLSAPTVASQPTNDTTCFNGAADFMASATNGETGTLTYQWQKKPSGGSFSDISNENSTTLSLSTIPSADDESDYRLIIIETTGTVECKDTSEAATLIVLSPPTITNPSPDTSLVNGSASFMAMGSNGESGNLTYQWQESTDAGTNFNNITDGGIFSNSTSTTLNLTGVQASDDAHQYRLIITESTGTIMCKDTSMAATLEVPSPLMITNPLPDTACVNGSASFTSTLSNGGTGTLTYQWQESNDGGGSFNNITDGGIYSNTNTSTLNLTGVQAADDENQFRLIVIETTGSIIDKDTSTAAILIVLSPPAISNPMPDTACVNGDASFTATGSQVESGSLTYQWQESTNGGTSFSDISDGGIFTNTSATTLNLTGVQSSDDEHQYRLIVLETTGTIVCKDTSTAATLVVLTAPSISMNPSNDSTCVNGDASFTATGSQVESGSLTYQWQESTNGGTSFSNISDGGIFTNTSTTTLNLIGVQSSDDEHQYRLIVLETTGTIVCKDTSTAATLVVLTAPSISMNPSNDSTCVNGDASFSATGSQGESGSLSYQWQESTNGGTSFSDISDGGIFTNTSATTLNLTGVQSSDDEHQYRLIILETTAR